jgi:hypothetical protein
MFGAIDWLVCILMVAGGVLGVSGLIVAKKPDAKQLIDKLVPFQAFIGVALLAFGLWFLIRVGPLTPFRLISILPMFAVFAIAATWGSMLLGFLFGMPQIAKWIPGESSAENKAMELSKKLAPFQLILGVVVGGGGLLGLLIGLGVMK